MRKSTEYKRALAFYKNRSDYFHAIANNLSLTLFHEALELVGDSPEQKKAFYEVMKLADEEIANRELSSESELMYAAFKAAFIAGYDILSGKPSDPASGVDEFKCREWYERERTLSGFKQ